MTKKGATWMTRKWATYGRLDPSVSYSDDTVLDGNQCQLLR
ncbi:MAG: hypothetical protein O7157_01405 [Wolbachia endosymbiont of Tetragnatha montana]|nr:hypothetical protein [Wolbachia endosymbiont of Tetragnatha montana]